MKNHPSLLPPYPSGPDTFTLEDRSRASRTGVGIPKPFSMKERTVRQAVSRSGEENRLLPYLVVILILLSGVYWWQSGQDKRPVTYRIGPVDGRFSMSSREAADAVRMAADVWSRAAGRELFREDRNGDIEVRFVYDYRQEASDKLKGMSGTIGNTKSSYDSLKARFESMRAEFRQKDAILQRDIREYNERVNDLNREMEAASRKGGVPEGIYRQFQAEKQELEEQAGELKMRQDEQNASAEAINDIVTVINEIAASLNLEVIKYNRTGSVLRSEFSEGLYERKDNRQTITIYHFASRARLVRVLAHELGHALGLQHSSNPRAIMYRLNQSDSLELAPDDIAALKAALKKKRA